jgi:NAD(P)-dependent dehydrogenase (short-subunit alcohol dehydrogenase family)
VAALIVIVLAALTSTGFDHHVGIKATVISRVVTISSTAHRMGAAIHFDDLQAERSYSAQRAYGQSKLANLLFTYELQRRLAGTDTIAVAAHPGASATELTRNLRPVLRAVAGVIVPLTSQRPGMGAPPALAPRPIRAARVASISAPTASPNCGSTRRFWHPVTDPTTLTSRSGCGRSPKN